MPVTPTPSSCACSTPATRPAPASAASPCWSGHTAGGSPSSRASRLPCTRPRSHQLLGLQHHRLLRAAQRYALASGDPGAGARVQDDGEGAARRAGIEVILDVVYNHTAEGNQLGPTLLPGLDNRTYYRLQARQVALLFRRHRLRQHARPPPPAGAEAGAGLAALLGQEMHVDGFRFDLARRWRAPAGRLRPKRVASSRHSPGPGALARQAHRRAVGRGAGGYQVGSSRRSSPSGTAATATPCAASGAATAAVAGELGLPPHRQQRPLRQRRPRADGEHQLRHRARRLHAADLVSYSNASTTRPTAKTTATARRQPLVELRRRGPDRRSRGLGAARAPAAQLPRDAVPLAGTPMLSAGDELGRTQRGNNNAYCQDNGVRGFRAWVIGRSVRLFHVGVPWLWPVSAGAVRWRRWPRGLPSPPPRASPSVGGARVVGRWTRPGQGRRSGGCAGWPIWLWRAGRTRSRQQRAGG
jgi:hypothetical protein